MKTMHWATPLVVSVKENHRQASFKRKMYDICNGTTKQV